ncbi:hypothetical protein NPIL_319191 [Nephila pilipes]|uniref:Uncharacterized protein n=1 Tax=Nephila pilipes TaxID=299642 RepID=A0A8X6TGY7_NEPPI|nr:hypothetical protein NPIL_319191 [Nephila pilipes]
MNPLQSRGRNIVEVGIADWAPVRICSEALSPGALVGRDRGGLDTALQIHGPCHEEGHERDHSQPSG